MDYLFNQFSGYGSLGWAIVSHILLAIPLWKMAERTKDEPRWFAWVPFLNGVLAIKIARKPLWWILLFFIPLVNFIMMIVLMMALCERFRMNKWWGLLGIITPANIVLLYYLAYATEQIADPGTSKVPDVQPAAPADTQAAPKPEEKPPQQ